jgi:hypothetical protein
MQGRLDEAEQIALKGGKRALQKLEGRVRNLEIIFIELNQIIFIELY